MLLPDDKAPLLKNEKIADDGDRAVSEPDGLESGANEGPRYYGTWGEPTGAGQEEGMIIT